MRVLHNALAILVMMAPGLTAQTFVYKPAPGSEIRITTKDDPAHRSVGLLDWVGRDSVVIRAHMRVDPDHRRRAFALANVRSIEVKRRGRDAALRDGAVIGVLAGGLLAGGDDQTRRNGVFIGAILGALVGQAVIPDRWAKVFPR
jgi:hypothetical protein